MPVGIAAPLLATWVIGFAGAAALLAQRRRRSPGTWAVYGGILGPIALALLVIAPLGRCPTCGEPVTGWSGRCATCGSDVRQEAVKPAMAHGAQAPALAAAGALGPSDPLAVAATSMAPGTADESDVGPVVPARTRRRRRTSASTLTPVELAAAADREPSTDRTRGTDSKPAPADPDGSGAAFQVIATGVFVGGTRPLVIGSRYLLSIQGGALEVRGPIDSSPNRVVVATDLAGVEASGIGDRLLISGTEDPSTFALGFASITGDTAESLERGINEARSRADTDRPRAR